jgi:hypothetical protein
MSGGYPETPGFEDGSATSEEAAHRQEPIAPNQRHRVLQHVIAIGSRGVTCDEVELALNMRHQTASARLRELFLANVIKVIGSRQTRSGRSANVYVIQPVQMEWLF